MIYLKGVDMSLDGFFIKRLILETKDNIINSRIEKIEQLNGSMFVFSLYNQKRRFFLYFKLNSPHACFFISNLKNSSNNFDSAFLKILRQNLEGYIIKDIKQKDDDRIIILTLSSYHVFDGQIFKELIIELMGRYNNLILTSKNIVIDAFYKRFSQDSRSIIPKIEFSFFQNDKKNYVYDPNLNVDNINFFSKTFVGISPMLSCFLFNNNLDLKTIKTNPTLKLTNNKFYWFDIFDENDEKINFENLSNLLEKIALSEKISTNIYEKFINKSLLNFNHKKEKLNELLKKAEDDATFKTKADYIYKSGYDLKLKLLEIKVENEIIFLNPLKTLNENAQEFYKKYQKSKRSILKITEQIEINDANINLMNQFLYDLTLEKENFTQIEQQLKLFGFKTKPIKKNKQDVNLPLKLAFEDGYFYIGKNNFQNEKIFKELANKNDLFFHVDSGPGSHVIYKGVVNDKILNCGATLAAYFSKFKNLPNLLVRYTQYRNLKRIPDISGFQVTLKSFKTMPIKIDEKLINSLLAANHLKKK